MRQMLKALRSESGVAMPVAVGVLMIVGILSTVLAQTAMNSTDNANEDSNIKHALGAAEAGLQVATYRLNTTQPDATQCVTDVAEPPQAGGECRGHTESVGNHGSYTYWVTPELPTNSPACGPPPPVPAAGVERCITVVGNVKGEIRRVQIRASSLPTSQPLWPVQGVLGLREVRILNNARVTPAVGSNGLIACSSNCSMDRAELGAGAPNPQMSRPPSQIVRHPTQFTLPPVPVGDTATTNMNATIVSGNGITYNAANRDLFIDGRPLTLGPGDYNFCRFRMGNNPSLVVTGPVRIFIDAPDAVRPGSGCPNQPGWGNVTAQNSADLNRFGDPTWLQILQVGWDPNGPWAQANGECRFDMFNALQMRGGIYSPFCQVHFYNAINVTGAIAGNQVQFDNASQVTYANGFDDIGRDGSDWARSDWRECPPQPSVQGDPESGC